MSDKSKLKDKYTYAQCCSPTIEDEIVGYYSHNNLIKIHKSNCNSLKKVDKERLLPLHWHDVVSENESFIPDDNYFLLDNIDFDILNHHFIYGIDYSLIVARKVNISKQKAFDRHKKLLSMKLIERVEPRIVQYRKGIVNNKWIKHRNHTYYQLTQKGAKYIKYYLANSKKN
ncbi:MAG: DUF2250 domain-containing protein [FCB group bacterium]|nr:DUF2250 domain-containing protein [FCB group bacterium]